MTGTRRTKKSGDYHLKRTGKITDDAESYKSKQVGTLMLFVFFPLFALIGLAISQIILVPPILYEAEDAMESMDNILNINNFLAAVEKEREMVSIWLGSGGLQPSSWDHGDVLNTLGKTDERAKVIYKWPKAVTESSSYPLKTKRIFLNEISKFRQQIGKQRITQKQSNIFYLGVLNEFVSNADDMVKLPEQGQVWKNIVSLTYLMRTETPSSQQLSLARDMLTSCFRTTDDLIRYYKFRGELSSMIQSAMGMYEPVEDEYKELFLKSDLQKRIESHDRLIAEPDYNQLCKRLSNSVRSKAVMDFEDYIEMLSDLKQNLIEKTIDELEDIADDARTRLIVYIVLLIFFVILFLALYIWHFHKIDDMLNETVSFAEVYGERFDQISTETEKADHLLYEMVPRPIAEKMKDGQSVEAKQFDDVTICYIDIVGFVAMISKYSPIHVIYLLQEIYRMYDKVMESGGHNIYKMEQRNDVYCAVSGITGNVQDHAAHVANFLIDIVNKLDHFEIEGMPDVQIKVRAGAHTGPCAAGLLGMTSPRYSIFGESVKMASRMSRLGDVQRIHISEQTKVALARCTHYTYNITPRGPVDVYGIGTVETYYLERY